jgi:hypothetical protein
LQKDGVRGLVVYHPARIIELRNRRGEKREWLGGDAFAVGFPLVADRLPSLSEGTVLDGELTASRFGTFASTPRRPEPHRNHAARCPTSALDGSAVSVRKSSDARFDRFARLVIGRGVALALSLTPFRKDSFDCPIHRIPSLDQCRSPGGGDFRTSFRDLQVGIAQGCAL